MGLEEFWISKSHFPGLFLVPPLEGILWFDFDLDLVALLHLLLCAPLLPLPGVHVLSIYVLKKKKLTLDFELKSFIILEK